MLLGFWIQEVSDSLDKCFAYNLSFGEGVCVRELGGFGCMQWGRTAGDELHFNEYRPCESIVDVI